MSTMYMVKWEAIDAKMRVNKKWRGRKLEEALKQNYRDNSNETYPDTIGRFSSYEKAKQLYNITPVNSAYRIQTHTGWLVHYEVAYIKKVEVNEDGKEVFPYGWTDEKWSKTWRN